MFIVFANDIRIYFLSHNNFTKAPGIIDYEFEF